MLEWRGMLSYHKSVKKEFVWFWCLKYCVSVNLVKYPINQGGSTTERATVKCDTFVKKKKKWTAAWNFHRYPLQSLYLKWWLCKWRRRTDGLVASLINHFFFFTKQCLLLSTVSYCKVLLSKNTNKWKRVDSSWQITLIGIEKIVRSLGNVNFICV